MSAIHDLISQIGDPRLRERLAAEWSVESAAMSSRLKSQIDGSHAYNSYQCDWLILFYGG